MKHLVKLITLVVATSPSFAFAAQSEGLIGIIENLMELIGYAGFLIIAVAALFGLWCLYSVGMMFKKLGNERERDEVKVSGIGGAVAGAIVGFYLSYAMGVAMYSVLGEDASSQSVWSVPQAQQN